MSTVNSVFVNNLGSEFDIGNIEANKIRLKIGSGLTILPDGTITTAIVSTVMLKNTVGVFDLNQSITPVIVPIEGAREDFGNSATDFTTVSGGVECNFDGEIEVNTTVYGVRVSSTGGTNRTVVGVDINKNSASTGVTGTMYPRAADASDRESAAVISVQTLSVVVGDTITLTSKRLSDAGAINLNKVGGSFLRVKRTV